MFEYDDGGRAAAGFKGSAGDCGTRAAAIALGLPYMEVYRRLAEIEGGTVRDGTSRKTMRVFMEERGALWTPTMKIGSGCTVHVRADELPSGRLVLSLSRHFAAVIDGVLRDTYDCSRDGTRCVYGYWWCPT